MKYYISDSQILSSYDNLKARHQKMNAFLGLLTLFLHGKKLKENYWHTDMVAFAKHLDNVFYLDNTKPKRDGLKNWFTLLQPNGIKIIKNLLLKDKRVSLQDCAIILMWDRPFENSNDLIDTFKKEIDYPELIDKCFYDNITVTMRSDRKCSYAVLRKLFKVEAHSRTLNFDGVKLLSKPAGDISAAPFSQTLYSGTSFRKAFTVCDFDFLNTYMLSSSITTEDPKFKNITTETCSEFKIELFFDTLKLAKLNFNNKFSTRFVASLQTKPFVILTGLSGSGKTKLAEAFPLWISSGFNHADIFKKGDKIEAVRSIYTIDDVDRLGVIVDQGGSNSKTCLPFELIKIWVKIIAENDFNSETAAQDIQRKVIETGISFSSTLNSFHSPLKALALKYIDSVKSQLESELNNQYCLVSVGADWTNREPLLGFPNALEAGKYIKPDCGALDLILRAEKDQARPYFLILDEMNMSHVERYFADFLSAMESTDGIISLHPDTSIWQKCDVPATIELPRNLFIIGTVNIDETTYMFSPKVLDRANVIEFRVEEGEMESYLTAPTELDMDSLRGAGASMGESFVDKAKEKGLVADNLKTPLMPFFKKLQEAGAEFGYRTASEISRFVTICTDIAKGKMNEEEVIDAAIMQKLLPKVHGSRNKIEKILKELGRLCLKDPNNEPFQLDDDKNDKFPVKYILSYEKLKRMHKRVIADGFTSFAEA